jgi:5-methylcytosine-specific restriction protein B
MPEEVEITIAGTNYRIDRVRFEARLTGVDPEQTTRKNKYFVWVGGRRYPAKQAVAVGLGAPLAVFQSQQAYHILRRLGYEVESVQ